MKRLLFLTLSVLCGLIEMYAQVGRQYNVTVKNSNGEPLRGVIVYSFVNEEQARAVSAIAGNSEYGFDDVSIDKSKIGLVEEGKTDESGLCIIRCMPNGAIVLYGYDASSDAADYTKLQIYRVKDYIASVMDNDIDLVLQAEMIITSDSKEKRGLDETGALRGTTQLKDLEKAAVLPMEMATTVLDRVDINHINVIHEVDIDGEQARSDARFAFFPHLVFEESDSVTHLLPAVVQGEKYTQSMERRMSFVPSRDKLEAYRFDHSMKMQDHNGERFLYRLENVYVPKGTKYHVSAYRWFEDYNGVYHRDSSLINDGKETEPLRFLDWSSVRELVPIDRSLYVKKGKMESVNANAKFNLDFVVGSSQLKLTDSVTVAQRDSMLNWISGYSNGGGEAFISGIKIRAYSSPEGSVKTNKPLSHNRARAIKELLAARCPRDVEIEMLFDEYDNIVTWDSIANMMKDMDDSVAHRYADQIKEIIKDKKDLDAQSGAISSAGGGLYAYLKSNILEHVRTVDVQATIIVTKVLTKDEIIAKYETDSEFRNGNGMIDYQYYTILCYLADKERWNELYDVAKRAYERFPKERVVDKMFRNPEVKDSLVLKITRDVPVPYPLAGYYYAAATLKKGMSDVNITKPYLDDGKAGNRPIVNSLPFVSNQVLMYCQSEEFLKAAEIVAKYHLDDSKRFPQLHGLVMFVKCLGGYYKKAGPEGEEVRKYVMGTSPMNKAVLHAAMGEFREALTVLYGSDVPKDDARVEYLKAVCHFNLLNSRQKAPNVEGYSSGAIYSIDEEELKGKSPREINMVTWAAPMLNAFRLDKSNVKYLENDGYFNSAYRQMLMYFWTRLQAGVPIAKVAKEYDLLVAQMRAKSKAIETVNNGE